MSLLKAIEFYPLKVDEGFRYCFQYEFSSCAWVQLITSIESLCNQLGNFSNKFTLEKAWVIEKILSCLWNKMTENFRQGTSIRSFHFNFKDFLPEIEKFSFVREAH